MGVASIIRDNDEAVVMGVLLAAFAALGLLLVRLDAEKEREWQAFAAKHNCEVVERREAKTITGYGITSNGKIGMVTTTIPAETAWLCDDGVTYWRQREGMPAAAERRGVGNG